MKKTVNFAFKFFGSKLTKGKTFLQYFNKNLCCFYFQLKPLKQWQTLVLLLYACISCQSLPQLRPSQRLSFTNLRDFITQLKTSSTLSRESLDNIKTNIQNIGKIEQPPPEVTTPPTRRPPYMFQGQKLLFNALTANVFESEPMLTR